MSNSEDFYKADGMMKVYNKSVVLCSSEYCTSLSRLL